MDDMAVSPWVLGLGFAMLLEGLVLFLVPAAWREAVQQMLRLRDGQLRFFGLILLMAGLLVMWLS
ncbi:MAG: DUF2065 domain-containing protein [Lautropia sp.]|nr:DUF2065 domain-containing protein [Lautropia sp.]